MQVKESKDVFHLIRHCYKSDEDHISRVHVIGEQGIDACVDRTVFDLAVFDVKVFEIWNNDKFIGYFGDEHGNLTGFFLMPEYRKIYKKEFWNNIVNHFDGHFTVGIWAKNKPAKKFLEQNDCNLVKIEGLGLVFEYNKEGA